MALNLEELKFVVDTSDLDTAAKKIKTLGEEIRMFLNSEELGRWAVIAMIDNQNGVSDFKNINTILKNEPTVEYLKNLS
jgi:hypothetical protein